MNYIDVLFVWLLYLFLLFCFLYKNRFKDGGNRVNLSNIHGNNGYDNQIDSILIMAFVWSAVSFRNASAMARAAYPDAATIAEQNQYKFTQINDLKLHPTIGDDNL